MKPKAVKMKGDFIMDRFYILIATYESKLSCVVHRDEFRGVFLTAEEARKGAKRSAKLQYRCTGVRPQIDILECEEKEGELHNFYLETISV